MCKGPTMNLGLKYKSEGENLESYVNASLGVSDVEGKSTYGMIIKLFNDIIMFEDKKTDSCSFIYCRSRIYSHVFSVQGTW